MNTELTKSLKAFLVELAVYAVLVFGYFFLVLHFLGGWLEGLYEHHRVTYATVALGLIIIQGVLLEALTRYLLAILKPGAEGR